jgi:uncharacterized protein YjbI with pentapeptide repeats
MDIPLDRCGSSCSVRSSYDDFEESSNWCLDDRTAYCWREPWREKAFCIWHADSDDKPPSELKDARSGENERLDGAILSRIQALDFPKEFFSGLNLSGASLHNADFETGHLNEVDFSGADLTDMYGENASFVGADFSDAELSGVILTNSLLRSAKFRDTDLRGVDLSECTLAEADFSRANLSGASLWLATFSETNFHEANLADTQLNELDLSNCDFHGADLSGAKLRNTDLSESNLEEADLTRNDLRNADLTDARLYEATISEIRINVNTEFGEVCAYDKQSVSLENSDVHRVQAAIWTYQRFEHIHRDFGLIDQANGYRYRKVESYRHC